MPPIVAAFLTVCFIVFLFRRDFREQPNVTGALWLPLIWVLLLGSRFVSQWLHLFGISAGAISLEEGSPLDASIFSILIFSGFCVLVTRGARLSEVVRNNRWLAAFFLYGFMSIAWSDFPFVAFKRWIVDLGHPIMALILLTEPDFEQALTLLLKRCAYVLVPVSILFIKYYPQWGRGYNGWNGTAHDTGITTDKNALGYDCMILGFFFVWHFLKAWKWERSVAKRNELLLSGAFLGMIAWLVLKARSSTSLVSLMVGVSVLVLFNQRFASRRFVGTYFLFAAVVAVVAEAGFHVSSAVVEMLGKDPTLTGRTDLWQDLLKVPINPFLGAGFESFWLGERKEHMWELHWWRPVQAHNGYIEAYLNLGLVGLFLMLALLFVTFWRARRELLFRFELGLFRLGFVVMLVVYDWTEAAFKGLSIVWFLFYVIYMDYPAPEYETTLAPEGEQAEELPHPVCAQEVPAG